MATEAPHTILEMDGAHEVHIFQAAFMTLEAPPTGLLRRELRESNYFCLVSIAFDVRRPGTMAVFASVRACLQQCEVRCPLKVLRVNLVMAAFAGIGAYVSRTRNCSGHLGSLLRRTLLSILRLGRILRDVWG